MSSNEAMRNFWPVVIGCAAVLAGTFASPARAELMLIGIDGKFSYQDGVRQALEPGHDSVLVYDLSRRPDAPELIGQLQLENSVIGPPTNLATTQDQSFALIANSMRSIKDGSSWKAVPADELFVVDVRTRPIQLLQTLHVGLQPSGISIANSGKFAVTANRAGHSVTLISLGPEGGKVAQTLDLPDSITAVAITPDEKTVLAAEYSLHKVRILAVRADLSLEDTGRELPVGLYPWNIAISPDGSMALVNNIGFNAASDGNAKTVSVIDLSAHPIRVRAHISVGDAPEGLAISPKGNMAAVTILQGSYDAPDSAWFRNKTGKVAILRLPGMDEIHSDVTVGAFPEGVGFSRDGRYLYTGNFADATLSILKLSGEGLVIEQRVVPLPGKPASLRVTGE